MRLSAIGRFAFCAPGGSAQGVLGVQRSFRVILAVSMLAPLGVIDVSSVGAASGTTCQALRGTAVLSPGLPSLGNAAVVRPIISVIGAKINGCRGPVTSASASGKLRFAKPSNCTRLISQITANTKVSATGTVVLTWSTHTTSEVAMTLTFGSVANKPTLATLTGTVTSGLFKGTKTTGTIQWSLGTTECFGGAPLTSAAFSGFAPFLVN